MATDPAAGFALGFEIVGKDGSRLELDSAEFEAGGAPDYFLNACRILHAGQFNHDAIRALLLNDRLGGAEFVDATADDFE